MANARITAELGLRVGNISGAINALATRVRRGLSPLANVQSSLNRLKSSFAPLAAAGVAAAGGIATVGAAAGALGLGAKRAMDLGGRLSDLAARTGAPVRELAILQQAFKNAGLSAEQVGPTLSRLQRALSSQANPQAVRALESLGLSAEELRNKLPTEQLQIVGAAISNLTDPAERAGSAMSIFGREGAALLALFDDSTAINTAAKQLGNQAQLLDENAAVFDRVSDALGAAFTKIQGFFVGVVSEIAPVFLDVVDSLNSLDLSKLGQQIGRVFAIIVTSFRDGSIFNIIKDSLIIAFSEAVNSLFRQLVGVGSAFGKLFLNSLSAVYDILRPLTTGEFWGGMFALLESAAFRYVKIILDAISSALEFLQPIISKLGLDGVVSKTSKSIKGLSELFGEGASNSWKKFSNFSIEGYLDRASSTLFSGILDSYLSGVDSVGDIISTEAAANRLGSALQLLDDRVSEMGEVARKSEPIKRAGKILSDEELDEIFEKEPRAGGSRPVVERLMSMGSAFSGGLFVKDVLARDPLLSESQKQTKLLSEIARKLGNPQQTTLRIDPKLVKFA